MRLYVSYKAGLVPGARLQRRSDGKWWHPRRSEWVDYIPVALIEGVTHLAFTDPADADAENSTYDRTQIYNYNYFINLPIDDNPDEYVVNFHGPQNQGFPKIAEPRLITINPPETLDVQGSVALPFYGKVTRPA